MKGSSRTNIHPCYIYISEYLIAYDVAKYLMFNLSFDNLDNVDNNYFVLNNFQKTG